MIYLSVTKLISIVFPDCDGSSWPEGYGCHMVSARMVTVVGK